MSNEKLKLEVTIRAVIDRVLWTAGATPWNKLMLAEAIADEILAANLIEKGKQ